MPWAIASRMQVRLFTLEEANALIPTLEDLVAQARRLADRVREAEAHVEDLRIVWGDELDSESCPERGEYEARVAQANARRLELQLHVEKFRELGVELKGIDLGLVDFYSMSGDQVVFLCWREGEKQVQAWHTLEGGFTGRRPIPDVARSDPLV